MPNKNNELVIQVVLFCRALFLVLPAPLPAPNNDLKNSAGMVFQLVQVSRKNMRIINE